MSDENFTDDEIAELLAGIEQEPPDPPPQAPEPQATPQPQIQEPELQVPPEPAPPPAPLEEPQPETVELTQGVAGMLSKFSFSVEEIINNQRSDRDQVEEAIQTIKSALTEKLQANESKGITPLLDNYVKSLQVKADINANASRALDSVAKLLASIKNNDVIVNVQGGEQLTGELDLESLLAQPSNDDE